MFPATLTRDHGHIRRILIVALATLMLFATLATLPNGIPAADAAEDKAVNYIIVFDNGTTIRGESASGSWDVEVPGTGMAVHMSCSDTFGNVLGGNETYEFWGWSDAWSGYSVSPAHAGGTGHPNPDDDSNWRIADYAFWRPDSSGGKCGNQNLRTPSIDIEKATNGFDADDPTGPQVVVGSTVTWTYVVTNTGNVPLSSVVVSDNVINDATISGPVGDVGADGILGLDEIWTYTATGIAIEGQYANNGSVEGYSGDTKVIDDDDSHYYGYVPDTPSIDIEKATNGFDADDPTGPQVVVGSTVTWTYVVTNTGNVPLSSVVVSDNVINDATISGPVGDVGADGILGLDEIWTYTATGIAIEGQYANNGSVEGYSGDTKVIDDDDSHYYGYVPDTPSIDIEKATNGFDADDPTGPQVVVGSTVTWTYVVTNTGNVPLSSVVVSDNVINDATISGPVGDVGADGILGLDEIWTYTATGIAIEGQYANNGSVEGYSGDTKVIDDDDSHYYGYVPDTPSIDIEKATNGFDADDPTGPQVVVGSTVTWTYVVTNTGNVPLSSVVVSDNVINDATISGPVGDVGADGILGLDEIWTYTATGIAIEGQYANNGSVEGYSGDTKVIDDDDSHYYGVPAPTLTLIKNVINTGGGTADASEWTLIAAPTDNGGFFGHGGPATGTVATLGPNPVIAGVEYTLSESGGPSRYIAGQWSCEISSPLLQDEIASSAISVTTGNKITLENGETGVCTIKNTYNPPPPPRLAKLTVVKNTIGADGEFWFLTGSGLSDFSIATSSNTGSQSFILNAGTYTVAEDLSKLAEFWSFEGPVVCTGATESSFTGASATVQLDPGDSATCTFTNKYTPPVPAIEIEKATNGWDADLPTDPDVPTITAGFPVTWTYVVTNVGDVDLTNVTVTDNKEDFICTIDLLKVGESEECTKEGVAGVVDYGNVGTAVGFYGETQVTDEDLSHYKGEFVAGTAQLGDTVWLDANNNGKQDNGEVGYNGAKVILTDANGNVVGTLTTATGAWVGFYKFLELDAGVYTATLDLSTIGDYGVTTAKSFKVTLAEGDDYVDADFGLYKAEELPKTGTDSEGLALLALGLLMMGGLAVLSTRRRPAEER